MNSIFKFISGFCVCSACIGAVYFLIPEGKLSKSVKYTVSICFICLIFSIFTFKAKIDFNEFNADYSPDITNVYEKTAVMTFKTALDKEKIEYSDLTVLTSKNSSGGIDIIEVNVYSSDNPQKIKETIGGEYEVNVYEE